MKKYLFKKVLEVKNFRSIMDGGDWNYCRFGFGELDGKCYRLELEGSESDEDVIELKEGMSVDNIIKVGEKKGFFDIDNDDIFYEMDLEDEMMEWIESLSK